MPSLVISCFSHMFLLTELQSLIYYVAKDWFLPLDSIFVGIFSFSLLVDKRDDSHCKLRHS